MKLWSCTLLGNDGTTSIILEKSIVSHLSAPELRTEN